MTKALLKNAMRDIKSTKARFLSILAIIALGVGFFAGVKATTPSMETMANKYYNDANLMDFRLLSTVGFDDKDVNAVLHTDCVSAVMPSYFADVIVTNNGIGKTVRVISIPYSYEDNSKMNTLTLTEGRMPKSSKEVVIDSSHMNTYNIGDTITVDHFTGETDVTDTLKNLKYKIVGKANSPIYISYERGTTTIGDGQISSYMYVGKSNFKSERYSELYVKTDYSSDKSYFVDDYDDYIAKVEKKLETVSDSQIQVFKQDNIESAQQKIDDGYEKYNKSKQEAEEKLTEAKKKLDDSQKMLDTTVTSAQKEISKNEDKIAGSEKELSTARAEYNSKISDGERQIKSAEKKLSSAQAEYKKAKSDYDNKIKDAQDKLYKAQAEYDSGLAEYNKNKEVAEKSIDDANMLIANLQGVISAVNTYYSYGDYVNVLTYFSMANTYLSQAGLATIPTYTLEQIADKTTFEGAVGVINGDITALNTVVADTQKSLDDAKNKLETAKTEIDNGKSSLSDNKAKGQQKLDDAKKEIDDGQQKLDDAKKELETQRIDGLNKLNSAQTQIDNGKIEIKTAKDTLSAEKTSSQKKIDSGIKKYNSKKSFTERKLNRAKKSLEDSQKKLDSIGSLKWYINNRNDNPGYSDFDDNAYRVDAVASVFPVFFLLVAVLVCITTLTRLVDEKRTEIGTLKALGYSSKAIVQKFLIYSLSAGIIGSAIGLAIGMPILPRVIYNAYKMMYYMPDITIVPNMSAVILAVVMALLCTGAVAVFSCMNILRKKPSALMRPKAPKSGKRILIERVTFLWKRFGFTMKVTLRNLMRYKARFFMTVIGVAGCTALIVAGMGLHDSIANIATLQYGQVFKYDTVLLTADTDTEENLSEIVSKVENDSSFKSSLLCYRQGVSTSYYDTKISNNIYLFVPQNSDKMSQLITLRHRNSRDTFSLGDNGVVITEKMANELSVNKGDTITINDEGKEYTVKVQEITENYIYGFIYMSPKLYEDIYGDIFDETLKYNMIVANSVQSNKQAETKIGNEYLNNDDIAAVSFMRGSIENFQDTVKSLDIVVLVMIICAGLLAFVVLYNLTNINLAERRREIATIKVLGFHNNETAAYIYRENIFLTVIGILVGLVMGVFLSHFIVVTVEVDSVMFGRDIAVISYLLSAALTAVFSLIVNIVMYFRMKKIDMIESLKSIE